MRTVQNRTTRPLRVKLPGGKTLHLGPGKTGQISDDAVESAPVQAMVEAGEIEITGEGGSGHVPHRGGGRVQEDRHGHHQPLGIPPKGDR